MAVALFFVINSNRRRLYYVSCKITCLGGQGIQTSNKLNIGNQLEEGDIFKIDSIKYYHQLFNFRTLDPSELKDNLPVGKENIWVPHHLGELCFKDYNRMLLYVFGIVDKNIVGFTEYDTPTDDIIKGVPRQKMHEIEIDDLLKYNVLNWYSNNIIPFRKR